MPVPEIVHEKVELSGKKKRPRGNLINPGMKKRGKKGAKFTNMSDESD